jgi:aquaporin Z
MTLPAKLLTELVGSFVFMTVIALAGGMGQLAPLAIGLGLCAMVYMGGHVSGAHYNPAVSFGLFLRRVIDARTMAAYWGAQVFAPLFALPFCYSITIHAYEVNPGAGVSWLSALASEIVFSAALVTVVLNVAATRATGGNSYYGIAIGFTVAAGAFAVGPISGAVFNPAVGIRRRSPAHFRPRLLVRPLAVCRRTVRGRGGGGGHPRVQTRSARHAGKLERLQG